jgi:hypothetical protein
MTRCDICHKHLPWGEVYAELRDGRKACLDCFIADKHVQPGAAAGVAKL